MTEVEELAKKMIREQEELEKQKQAILDEKVKQWIASFTTISIWAYLKTMI